MSEGTHSAECKQCAAPMTENMARLTDYCIPCLERAMDQLTTADIKGAMDNLIASMPPKTEPEPRHE